MSTIVLSDLYTATNADVPRLPWFMRVMPEQVILHDPWAAVALLSDFAAGPFAVTEEDGHFVLHGRDRLTGAAAKLRITETTRLPHAVQYCNNKYKEWAASPISWIILLPISHREVTPDVA